MTALPTVSIVIPVHNEEAILHAAVVDLRERLEDASYAWELILSENGSSDQTVAVATALASKYPNIIVLHTPEPNYGRALRVGIEHARGEIVICDEIDLCDTEFHQRAIQLLESSPVDLVIGSKLLSGASDERPFLRHAASHLYSKLLRWTLGFQGTDTHGLKAMRRLSVLPVLATCVVDRDVFSSELVIRSERARLRVLEIPIRVMEKRPPTINLIRRVPHVIKSVARLAWALRQ
ncbi:MAG TPA: glycosyltransferase family 2 protein [Polyangiaceae bacterium]|nr:glycosyltransferase family 2 protein [Polyangiaceae bacterium]